MPRYLYLLRHAQSAEKQTGQTDKGRELTREGMEHALRVGRYLFREKTFPDIILSSTAERAKATASIVSEVLKIDSTSIQLVDDLYEASTRTFLSTISAINRNYMHALCVAHNPTISYLAEYLTKAEIGEMVPAGLAIIHFQCSDWAEVSEGNGTLISYLTPNDLINRTQ